MHANGGSWPVVTRILRGWGGWVLVGATLISLFAATSSGADTRTEADLHLSLSEVEDLLRNGRIDEARARFRQVSDPDLWAFLQGRQLAIAGHLALQTGQRDAIFRAAEALSTFARTAPPRDTASAVEAYTRACTLFYIAGHLVEAMDAGLDALELRHGVKQSGIETLDIKMEPLAALCLAQSAARSGHSEMSASALAQVFGRWTHTARTNGTLSDAQIDWFFRTQHTFNEQGETSQDLAEITRALKRAASPVNSNDTSYMLSKQERAALTWLPTKMRQFASQQKLDAFMALPLAVQLDRINRIGDQNARYSAMIMVLEQGIRHGRVQAAELLRLVRSDRFPKPAQRAVLRGLLAFQMILEDNPEGTTKLRFALADLRDAAAGNMDEYLFEHEFRMLRWIIVGTEVTNGGKKAMADRLALAEFLSRLAILCDCQTDLRFATARHESLAEFLGRADAALYRIGDCRRDRIAVEADFSKNSAGFRTPITIVDMTALPTVEALSEHFETWITRRGEDATLKLLDDVLEELRESQSDNPVDHSIAVSLAHDRKGQLLSMLGHHDRAAEAFGLSLKYERLAYPVDALGFPEPLENDRVNFFQRQFREDRIAHTLVLRAKMGGHSPAIWSDIPGLRDRMIEDLAANEAPGLAGVSRLSACLATLTPERAQDMRQRRGAILRKLDRLRGVVEALKTPDAPLPDLNTLRAYFEEARAFGKRFRAYCPDTGQSPTFAALVAALQPDEVYLFPFIVKTSLAGSILVTPEGGFHLRWGQTGVQAQAQAAALAAATDVPAYATDGDLRNLPQPWAEAFDLYNTFIGDFAPIIGDRTIIWSPNRSLADLPLAMLVHEDPAAAFDVGDVAFLGLKNPILRVADTASFAASRQRGPAAAGQIAAFGAPDAATLTAHGLAPLPGAFAVLDSLAGARAARSIGADATAEALLTSLADPGLAVLAIATHVLAPDEAASDGSPGIFTAPDARGSVLLRRHAIVQNGALAPLILLVGCQSGASDGALEDAFLSGLPRAFLEAGSRNVLVSSNRLLDSAAPQLARSMIDGVRAGKTGAMALRDAMVTFQGAAQLGEDGLTSAYLHPAVWGTLTLVGDGMTGRVQ